MHTTTPGRLLAGLLLGSVCLSSCSRQDEVPTPADPAPAFTLNRYLDFTTTAPGGGVSHSGGGTIHAAQDISGEARLDAPGKVLVMSFKAAPDEVYFEVDQAQLKPGWTDTYALRCRTRPAAPVFISYLYTNASLGNTAILRLSDWAQQLNGSVSITAYDARRHLVSGSYEVTAPDQRDPTVPGLTSAQRCTILLAGDFTNLKVQY